MKNIVAPKAYGSLGSHVVDNAINQRGSSMLSASHCSQVDSSSNHSPNSAMHSVNHIRSG